MDYMNKSLVTPTNNDKLQAKRDLLKKHKINIKENVVDTVTSKIITNDKTKSTEYEKMYENKYKETLRLLEIEKNKRKVVESENRKIKDKLNIASKKNFEILTANKEIASSLKNTLEKLHEVENDNRRLHNLMNSSDSNISNLKRKLRDKCAYTEKLELILRERNTDTKNIRNIQSRQHKEINKLKNYKKLSEEYSKLLYQLKGRYTQLQHNYIDTLRNLNLAKGASDMSSISAANVSNIDLMNPIDNYGKARYGYLKLYDNEYSFIDTEGNCYDRVDGINKNPEDGTPCKVVLFNNNVVLEKVYNLKENVAIKIDTSKQLKVNKPSFTSNIIRRFNQFDTKYKFLIIGSNYKKLYLESLKALNINATYINVEDMKETQIEKESFKYDFTIVCVDQVSHALTNLLREEQKNIYYLRGNTITKLVLKINYIISNN